jgi:hypothetical protein
MGLLRFLTGDGLILETKYDEAQEVRRKPNNKADITTPMGVKGNI